jgi:hypothetical protein
VRSACVDIKRCSFVPPERPDDGRSAAMVDSSMWSDPERTAGPSQRPS